jgi:carboxymethylenebutenolidase
MRSGLDELAKRAPGKKLGAMGFCFGGNMTWRLIGSKDDRLRAAIPFYGPLPEDADFRGIKAAVMAMYGSLDKRVNATRDAAEAKLKEAGATYEINVFEGADHAFFNDTGPRYNADAAKKAWVKVLDWLGRYT